MLSGYYLNSLPRWTGPKSLKLETFAIWALKLFIKISHNSEKDFVQSILTKVQVWLENSEYRSPLILEKCNGFQRRMIYSTIKPKFSEDYSFHMETIMPKEKTARDRSIMLTKVSTRVLVQDWDFWFGNQQKVQLWSLMNRFFIFKVNF